MNAKPLNLADATPTVAFTQALALYALRAAAADGAVVVDVRAVAE